MIKSIVFLLSLLTLVAAPVSAQQHGYAIHYIHGEGSVDGIKLAYQYHPKLELPAAWRHFDVHFESSINFWRYGDENRHDGNFVLAVSPVIRYPFTTLNGHPIALEFGIGLALLDDTQFAGKNVSTHYQFEDRLGLVYQLDNANIAIRYMHYSNAGFKSPNPGLDFLSLSYSAYF
ncbi:acyloxyacyl hydrolase [Pseudoalteromonas sp. OOF1S-7]|uniref:acyloxyacyl hydrolase n=1 Tax=Pseudoalteromonas sp. OOF1S-7 TaxID=2917757 RepID=UPI001EF5A3A1|nr:acyloxyacyl hydrolase [Pseudoalteromonas sp. OOF1S-7]MCG7533526.1 acyloxyacyl hydrolase [Pseudoalteromonas sp. OOF1S-7]